VLATLIALPEDVPESGAGGGVREGGGLGGHLLVGQDLLQQPAHCKQHNT